MKKKMDINCDLGESYYTRQIGHDKELIPLISSCNIGCGFHGGDPLTIKQTIGLALKHHVHIGAHPSYPDLEGLGRKDMTLSEESLRAILCYQIGALKSMTAAQGGRLYHVKPHGALYNKAAKDLETARIIATEIQEIDSKLTLLGMAHSKMEQAAREIGLPFAAEVFADRNYTASGQLVPRTAKNALLDDPEAVLKHSMAMIQDHQIITEEGTILPVVPQSICIHGDSSSAPSLALHLRERFKALGITLQSFSK